MLFVTGVGFSQNLVISEIFVNPSGTDSPHEYIELRGDPGATIAADTYLIQVEGDSTDPGDIESNGNATNGCTVNNDGVTPCPQGGIISLGGVVIGSNGFVVILTTGNDYIVDPRATKLMDVTDGDLEGQSHSFLLINTNGNGAPSSSDDIDDDNNGEIDAAFTNIWTILDGISFIDDDASTGEGAYGNVIFVESAAEPLMIHPAASTVITTSTQYDYAARIGNSTGSVANNDASVNAVDWVGSDIPSSTSSPRVWNIGSNSTSVRAHPEIFEGALLNHIGSENSITWDGSSSTDWDTAANYTPEILPSSTIGVIIPSGLDNYPTATSAVTTHRVNMASGTSLIAQSTFSGTVSYNRSLGTTNWYLIGSPVVGQDEDDFATVSGLATGSGSNQGLASYNTLNNTWTYYQGTTSANTLTNGQGYSVKLAATGGVYFDGTLLTDDLTPINLTKTGDGYNLIGNPYPSYINSATMLTTSSASLDSQTIWVWNQATNMYDPKVTGDTFQIAPGQGFFVKSDGAAGTLAINEAFQSHQGTDTFQKSNSKSEIHLNLTDGTNVRLAKLYYIDGATTGFDNGFDGPMFTGVTNSFSLFTKSINSSGRDLGIQSLPKDYENMIVPIGVNALSGKEITFSAEALNLPEGINVYIEDRVKNTYTRLDEANATYKVILSENLDGTGRFYIHTSSKSTLSINENNVLNNISIFKTNDSTLRIVGLQQGNASVKLFNVLGKQIINSTFNATGFKDVTLPNFASGVYIVQLQTESGKLSKKIILE